MTGVLLHLGESANGGHYIAHLLDDATGIWWRFNDSIVSKIDISEIADFKANQPNYSYYSDHFYAKELKSENAYMLIYTRHNSDFVPAPNPPPFALERVEKTNEAYLNRVSYSFSSFSSSFSFPFLPFLPLSSSFFFAFLLIFPPFLSFPSFLVK